MEKKPPVNIIIWAIVASVLVNVFFSRWITAKISTLPVLNRLNLLNPQAPIVIKERQEIRVSAEAEVGEVIKQARGRTSQIGLFEKGEFKILGRAINFASDGVFITSSLLMPAKPANLQIRLADGKIIKVSKSFVDKDTGLVFLKSENSSVSLASFGETAKLALGDRLLFFTDLPEGEKYFETQVNFLPLAKDLPFGFQNSGVETYPGEVVVNYKGEILGIWHKQLVVSEKIKSAFNNYLKSQP